MSNAKPNTQPLAAMTEAVTPISMAHAPQVAEAQSPDVLMERIRQLEAEKAEAIENAKGFREQYETMKAKVGQSAEMRTTTTKPTYKFAVSGPNGPREYDVVDESEAKRLYCIEHKLEPSSFVINVKCVEAQKRRDSVIDQFDKAGWKDHEAIPKHLIPAA